MVDRKFGGLDSRILRGTTGRGDLLGEVGVATLGGSNGVSNLENISNKALTMLLSPYVVDKFLTHSLINQTKKHLRLHLFGDPVLNVTYLPALVSELKAAGHD